jgi:hypothetical protein
LFKKLKEVAGGVDGDLLAQGRLGRGIVTNVELTGAAVTIGVEEHRVCQLTAQVFLDGEQPYLATVRQRIPVWMLGSLAAGSAVVAVRVAPTDLRTIAIDLRSAPPIVTLGRPRYSAAEVLATGAPVDVVIAQGAPLGVRSYTGDDIHVLTLTVLPPGAAPYQVQVGVGVPATALPLLFPGSRLPARVAPGDPNGIAIDWEAAFARVATA